MAPLCKVRISENDRWVYEMDLTGPLELGRQRKDPPEPPPYAPLPALEGGSPRLVIAHNDEANCSRKHLRLEPLPSGAVHVCNTSQAELSILRSMTPLSSWDWSQTGSDLATRLAPKGELELQPPFALRIGSRAVVVETSDSVDDQGLHGLNEATMGPGSLRQLSAMMRPLPSLNTAHFNDLIGWLQTTMGVLQSTVGGADFLKRAAEAVVQIVGLDSGRVLLFKGEDWTVAAACPPQLVPQTWQPSKHVLQRVRQEKRTFWQAPSQTAVSASPSLVPLLTVVSAPILDGAGNVIGLLYGERRKDSSSTAAPLGKLEAMLVDLLACGVSTGLARQEHEQSALRNRTLFEQSFSSDLARQLARDPTMLDGRQAEVTIVFADVREFSRSSERLGPAVTLQWIGDVMEELSACTLNEGGTLVDYIGDEIMAMWGAPVDQADQAQRAVRAALAMLEALPRLSQRWQQTVGTVTDLGIGISSGPAQVGKTGSRFKFKYGPLGNTVNLASRVRGLTKYLRCRLLVTASTRRQLDDRFLCRRVCKVRAVNIEQPYDLFEVDQLGSESRRAFFQESELALDALEGGNPALAARKAGELLMAHPDDGPLLLVLSRAAQLLIQPTSQLDPVWEPPGK